ncbi:hypothetical protein PRZ48_000018 [Zasmidium cellare]|uniref:Heterokaryon incompatibility domain-containing protein n=1 Tax=Zasmidium cellare TaxID=395010 RepID=A0ABR0EZP6_ZASCE|nr:hypothetical protein PRZ48_000018 [Zasmidium cellare]
MAGQGSRLAAAALAEVVSQHTSRVDTYPSGEFKHLFERCFAEAQGHGELSFFHRQAVRIAVESGDIDLVRFLLEKDSRGSLLSDEPDILQLSLRSQDHYIIYSPDPIPLAKLLLQHGAQINGLDSEGNTALFYAAGFGLPATFTFLIDNGADIDLESYLLADNSDDPRSNHLRDTSEASETERVALSLMQVALHAIDHYWQLQDDVLTIYKHWGPIIVFFIDARFSDHLPENLFMKLTEAACSTGEYEAANKLLLHQSKWKDGVCAFGDSALDASSLTPALQAATGEGDVEMVKLLLRFGANPRLPRQPTVYSFTSGPGKPLWQAVNESHGLQRTIIETVCGTDIEKCREPPSSAVLDACEILFWEGICDTDKRLVLAEAALQGRVDIVGRLWATRVHLDQVPLTHSVPVLDFFYTKGATFNWAALQILAVQACKVDTIDWLVERAGPCVDDDEAFILVLGKLSKYVPRHGENSLSSDAVTRRECMFAFLCTKYAPPHLVGVDFHCYVNRLILKSSTYHLSHMQLLLREAVRSGCPGIQQACFEEMKSISGPQEPWELPPAVKLEVRVRMLQLLYQCHQGTLPVNSQKLDDEEGELWLAPCMMEMEFEKYSTMQRGEVFAMDYTEAKIQPPEDVPLRSLESSSPQVREDASPAEDSFCPADEVDITTSREGKDIGASACLDEKDTPLGIFSTQMSERDVGTEEELVSNEEIYKPLGHAYSTRLLTLAPSQDLAQPIQCTLKTVHLAERPAYEALSYVWGDETDTATIQVNSKTRHVRPNLRAALARLRFSKRPRTLWIDALCINQRDIGERNDQVRIMSTIYQAAKRVLIWVGESGDGSTLVFDYMRKLRAKSRDSKQVVFRDEPDDDGTEQQPWSFSYASNAKGRLILEDELDEAFETLCSRPWFSRTWVIQEFALSTQAVVVCGGDKELWSPLREVYPESRLGMLDGIRLSVSNSPWNDRKRWRAEKLASPSSSDIEGVLHYSTRCDVTEPRDRVYALLGFLANPSVKVDYRLPVEEVYASFTQAIFEQDRSIRLLHTFGFQKKMNRSHSWVMDFSVPSTSGRLPIAARITLRDSNVKQHALLSSVMSGFKIQGSTMYIWGYTIDHIREIGPALPIPPTSSPRLLATDPLVQRIIQTWSHLACTIKKPSFPTPIPAAFVHTLNAHDPFLNPHHEPVKYSRPIQESCAAFGFDAFTKSFPAYFRDAEIMYAWQRRMYPTYGYATGMTPLSLGEHCHGRSFFTTRKGTMGLCDPAARMGDLAVFLPGGLYPFTLRYLGDGTYSMLGDCYLYGLDMSGWDVGRVKHDFGEFRIR